MNTASNVNVDIDVDVSADIDKHMNTNIQILLDAKISPDAGHAKKPKRKRNDKINKDDTTGGKEDAEDERKDGTN